MNRAKRRLYLILNVLLVLLLPIGLTGCKKQPFVQIVNQTLYLGLPANMDNIYSIDMERLTQIDGFNETLTAMENDPVSSKMLKPVIEGLRQRVGFDPVKDLGLVIIATRGPNDPAKPFKNTVIIAHGNFKDPGPKLDKLRDWLNDDYLADTKKTQSVGAGDIVKFQITGKNQLDVNQAIELDFAFPTDSLMVLSASSQLLGDCLDVISGQVDGVQKDPGWKTMLARPYISATAWGAGQITPEASKSLVAAFPDLADQARVLKQYFFDINFASDFTAHIGLVCDSIDSAGQLTEKLRKDYDRNKPQAIALIGALQAPETAKLPDKIKIINELEAVTISLKISEDEVRVVKDEWEKIRSRGLKTIPPLSIK